MSAPDATAATKADGGVVVVVAHSTATQEIAVWLERVLLSEMSSCRVEKVVSEEANFFPAIVGAVGESPAPGTCLVIIAVFFDGLSDEAKTIYLPLKAWAAAFPQVVLQALNAKRGEHTLFANPQAVVSSIAKRIPSLAAPGSAVVTSVTVAAATSAPSGAAAAGGAAAADGGKSATDTPAAMLVAQDECYDMDAANLLKRISAGQGECFWTVTAPNGGIPDQERLLRELASSQSCGLFPVTAAPKAITATTQAQEYLVRRAVTGKHMELRIAMCGNVDSGKSTLTSVITKGFRDDGRGLARAKVFNHQHEQDTGRTSSISEQHLAFDGVGSIVNYPVGGPAPGQKALTPSEMAERAAKVLTLFDLAGHEKYLKTTVLGMTRNMPDYACIVISANNGIQRMTKEHLGLCLALHLPFYVVVTRIDATPDNVRMDTMVTINKLLKVPTVKKLPFPVKTPEDIIVAAKNLRADRITPIFEVSNVTGQGMPELLHFLNLLPLRRDWSSLAAMPKEMIIDNTFFVTGVGTVVGGIVTQGVFRTNDTVLLGPDALGNFRSTQIKSIHVKGVEVSEVTCGQDAALCLKKEKRNAIRKGNVLVDASSCPRAYWMFEAEIRVLYHSTTISTNYEPVIHSQTVRQSARLIQIDQEVLRTGDHAIVRFHFLYRPEYIKVNQRLIFREGRTKGIGTITSLVEGTSDAVMALTRSKLKAQVRDKHDKPAAAATAAAAAAA